MAKELPYFQFEPAEYLTKNVSFCSLAAQGLFINICSFYWQRNCQLTKAQVLKRFNYPGEIEELIQEGVIDISDDLISIKFLNAQFSDVVEKQSESSLKGKIGNLKRWNKEVYSRFLDKKITLEEALEIAKPSGGDKSAIAKTSHIREDKIREDEIKGNKKRKENIKKSSRFAPPKLNEVYDFMIEKKVSAVTAKIESQKFIDFYSSKNWMVGKNKMAKWKSAVSGWITRMSNFNNSSKNAINRPNDLAEKMTMYDG